MQLTTLNKVFSLFLTGGLATVLLTYIFLSEIEYFIISNKAVLDITTFAILFGIVVLGSISALGAVIDGLSNLLREFFIVLLKSTVCQKWIPRLFLVNRVYREYIFWQEKAKEIDEYNLIENNEEIMLNDELVNSLSVGLFFRGCSPVLAEWGIRHYCTFVLVSNYIVIFVAFALYLVFQLGWRWLWLSILVVPTVLYGLCVLAADRYFYSYKTTLRNARICFDCRRRPLGTIPPGSSCNECLQRRCPMCVERI